MVISLCNSPPPPNHLFFPVVSTCRCLVSGRLVEAESLDWRLIWVSDERLLKWFRKSCRILKLGLHLNWAMLTSVPTSIVYIQHRINSPLSWKLYFLPFKYCKPHKYIATGQVALSKFTVLYVYIMVRVPSKKKTWGMPGTDIYFIFSVRWILDRIGWGAPFIILKKSVSYIHQ